MARPVKEINNNDLVKELPVVCAKVDFFENCLICEEHLNANDIQQQNIICEKCKNAILNLKNSD